MRYSGTKTAGGKKKRLDWEEWYAAAEAYRAEHGDLLIPRSYVTPDSLRLGRWIERQRAVYNDVPSIRGCLDAAEIAMLDRLGMVWKLENRYPRSVWLRELRVYRSLHGDVLVPAEYRQGKYALGNWVAEQRKRYARGVLTAAQKNELEALGMDWSPGIPRRAWMDWYEDARAYRERCGNLLVQRDYVTPEGRRLGVWIFSQREAKAQSGGLTEQQVALLDALGMVWDLNTVRDEAWERMFAWVSEYRRERGALPTKAHDRIAPDGRAMSDWINAQKEGLAKGRLSEAKAGRLAALGIERRVPRGGEAEQA